MAAHLDHNPQQHQNVGNQNNGQRPGMRQIASYGLIVLRRNFDGKAPDGFIRVDLEADSDPPAPHSSASPTQSSAHALPNNQQLPPPPARRNSSSSLPQSTNSQSHFQHGQIPAARRASLPQIPFPPILDPRPRPSTHPYSVLLVQKRHSHSLCDIVSGRIPPNVGHAALCRVVDELAVCEKRLIQRCSFRALWTQVAAPHKRDRTESSDYRNGERRFGALRSRLNMLIQRSTTSYRYSELGFPKGRIERAESKLRCAIREFEEETGYKEIDICIPDPQKSITETFRAADGRIYVHTYYIAILKDPFLAPQIAERNDEIANIGWVPLDKLENRDSGYFRDYEITKWNVLRELKQYIQSPTGFLLDL